MCKRYNFFPSSPFLSLFPLMPRRPVARAGAADSLNSRPNARARDDVPDKPKARAATSSRTKTKVGFWALHPFFDAYRAKKKVAIQPDPSDEEEFSLEGISEDEDDDDDDDKVSDTSGPPPNRLPVGTPALNPPQLVGSKAYDINHFFTETVSISPTNVEEKNKTCTLCM
jgi:hypothetical protein